MVAQVLKKCLIIITGDTEKLRPWSKSLDPGFALPGLIYRLYHLMYDLGHVI